MAGLSIELKAVAGALVSTWTNTGTTPLALAFWWNRRLRVTDALGKLVAAGRGPELPCGAQEDWTVLEPGQTFERTESLGCTQPAGRGEDIGWSYDLAPGTYRVQLLFDASPAHGFSQSPPEPRAFRGSALSNEIELIIPPKPAGFFARLFGG